MTIRTLMAEAAMQGANLLIRSNLGFGLLLKDTSLCSQGITEPATLRLLDDLFYFLSHSRLNVPNVPL